MTSARRVAVFIDAENVSAKFAKRVFGLCSEWGDVKVARCYGHAAALKGWDKAQAEYHIRPVLTPGWADKGNASDFSLVIDAVSLLLSQALEDIVIVSSDADFAQLAVFAREHGAAVHGIG